MGLNLEHRINLLHVEDEPDIKTFVSESIFNYPELKEVLRITEASDVQEAIRYLNNGFNFNIALVDFKLPGGDGNDVGIVAKNKGVYRIIGHSAFFDPKYPEKPFDRNIFHAVFRKQDYKDVRRYLVKVKEDILRIG